MFDNSYIYVPYWLFVLLVGIAFIGLEHVVGDLARGLTAAMDWLERRRAKKEALPPAPSILSIDDFRRDQGRRN